LQWYYCVTNLQTHAHTFTDKNHGRMLFPCALHAAKPRHVRHFWFRVFQFAWSHRFWNKNYGLSVWRPRYEWRFVKHQRTDDLPQSVLTVDSHCQSTCKVGVHSCQSFISCGAELLTARHLICASKRLFGCQNLHCHFVKPHVFAVSRVTSFHICSQISAAIQSFTCERVRRKSIFPPIYHCAKNKALNFQQDSRVPALRTPTVPFVRSFFTRWVTCLLAQPEAVGFAAAAVWP